MDIHDTFRAHIDEMQSLIDVLGLPHPERWTNSIRDLLEQGASARSLHLSPGGKVLGYAIHHAQTAEHSRLLLEHGAQAHPHVVDDDGRTALHRAQDPAQVALLLAHGADLAAQDNVGNSPLHTAANAAVAEALIAQGADLDAVNQAGVRARDLPLVMGADINKSMQAVVDVHSPEGVAPAPRRRRL